jgi:hypothetical protein
MVRYAIDGSGRFGAMRQPCLPQMCAGLAQPCCADAQRRAKADRWTNAIGRERLATYTIQRATSRRGAARRASLWTRATGRGTSYRQP